MSKSFKYKVGKATIHLIACPICLSKNCELIIRKDRDARGLQGTAGTRGQGHRGTHQGTEETCHNKVNLFSFLYFFEHAVCHRSLHVPVDDFTASGGRFSGIWRDGAACNALNFP